MGLSSHICGGMEAWRHNWRPYWYVTGPLRRRPVEGREGLMWHFICRQRPGQVWHEGKRQTKCVVSPVEQ